MIILGAIVIDADPTHNEAKMKLAELYEILDEPRKALDLVYQGNSFSYCYWFRLLNPLFKVIDSRAKSKVPKEHSDTPQARGQTHASLFEEIPRGKSKLSSRKSRKLTPAQLHELEEQKERDVVRGYRRVEELWPRLLDEIDPGQVEAEREWMFEVEKLVDMFRETRMLFLTSRVCCLLGMLCVVS